MSELTLLNLTRVITFNVEDDKFVTASTIVGEYRKKTKDCVEFIVRRYQDKDGAFNTLAPLRPIMVEFKSSIIAMQQRVR